MAKVSYNRGELSNLNSFPIKDGQLIIGYDLSDDTGKLFMDIDDKRCEIGKPEQKNGGVILNNKKTNQATTIFSAVSGINSIAGWKGYPIIRRDIVKDEESGSLTLVKFLVSNDGTVAGEKAHEAYKLDGEGQMEIPEKYFKYLDIDHKSHSYHQLRLVSADAEIVDGEETGNSIVIATRIDGATMTDKDSYVLNGVDVTDENWISTCEDWLWCCEQVIKTINSNTNKEEAIIETVAPRGIPITCQIAPVALGNEDFAAGNGAFSVGRQNKSIGDYSITLGRANKAGYASFAVGRGNNAMSMYAFAANANNKALGTYSAAFGQNSEANGQYSFAFGEKAKANGTRSAAFGSGTSTGTEATGAFVTGSKSQANGVNSFSGGDQSVAKGKDSNAFGYKAITDGDFSTAMGYMVSTTNKYQAVFGKFSKMENDILFGIGNGTDNDNRSNAFSVFTDGHAEVKVQGETDNSIVTIKTLNDSLMDIIGQLEGSGLSRLIVDQLPEKGSDNIIYMIKNSNNIEQNAYDEYMFISGAYELIGSTQVDLSDHENRIATAEDTLIQHDQLINTINNTLSEKPGLKISSGGEIFSDYNNNKANGIYSSAFGYCNNIKTKGEYSAAFGTGNIIEGERSFAFGQMNEVNGNGSFAIGYKNTVPKDYSFVVGYQNTNVGYGSAGFGMLNNFNNNKYSFLFGSENTSNSSSVFLVGYANAARGGYNTVFGSANIVYSGGYGTVFGSSHQIGQNSNGDMALRYAHVSGQEHFIDTNTTIMKEASDFIHVEGKSHRIQAAHSAHIEGLGHNIQNSARVHVEGNMNTIKYGKYSYVGGSHCIVDATNNNGIDYSSCFIHGSYLTASGAEQILFGKANDKSKVNVKFAIGNGTVTTDDDGNELSRNGSNLFTIYNNGMAELSEEGNITRTNKSIVTVGYLEQYLTEKNLI